MEKIGKEAFIIQGDECIIVDVKETLIGGRLQTQRLPGRSDITAGTKSPIG